MSPLAAKKHLDHGAYLDMLLVNVQVHPNISQALALRIASIGAKIRETMEGNVKDNLDGAYSASACPINTGSRGKKRFRHISDEGPTGEDETTPDSPDQEVDDVEMLDPYSERKIKPLRRSIRIGTGNLMPMGSVTHSSQGSDLPDDIIMFGMVGIDRDNAWRQTDCNA